MNQSTTNSVRYSKTCRFLLVAMINIGMLIPTQSAFATDILVNGSFDSELSPWGRFRSAGFDPDVDVNESANSGSVRIWVEDGLAGSINQRPFINGSDPLALRFFYKVDDFFVHLPNPVKVTLQFLGPECVSSSLYVLRNDPYLFQARGGGWKPSSLIEVVPPEKAVCVAVLFGIENKLTNGYYLDNVRLQPLAEAKSDEIIFQSGFD